MHGEGGVGEFGDVFGVLYAGEKKKKKKKKRKKKTKIVRKQCMPLVWKTRVPQAKASTTYDKIKSHNINKNTHHTMGTLLGKCWEQPRRKDRLKSNISIYMWIKNKIEKYPIPYRATNLGLNNLASYHRTTP
jgi:hypothetical protein